MKLTDVRSLHLDLAVRDALLRSLRRTRPWHELCGFVLGSTRRAQVHGTQVLPVRNTRQRPGSFAISRGERQRASRHARAVGVDLIAIYHSHPAGDGEASPSDRESIGRSDLPWIIITAVGREDGQDGGVKLTAYSARTGTPLDIAWL